MPIADELHQAIKAVLDAEDRFLRDTAIDWEGDPLSDAIKLLRDRYAALAVQPQGEVKATEGWVMVPALATEEMETAARSGTRAYHDIQDRDWSAKVPKDIFRLAWRHMIAAAPRAAINGGDNE